jgi:glutaredoxin-related protein
MALTMSAMKRFKTAKVVINMKGTKKSQACGCFSMTGRTIPIDQLSRVMIWKSV